MNFNHVVCHLRQNSRIPLTTLSKKTHVAVDDLNTFLRTSTRDALLRPTVLLDFRRIGYPCTILFQVSIHPAQHRVFIEKLQQSKVINNLFRIIGQYDFIGEAVFPSKLEAEHFFQNLRIELPINQLSYYFMTEEICRETLLTSPCFYA